MSKLRAQNVWLALTVIIAFVLLGALNDGWPGYVVAIALAVGDDRASSTEPRGGLRGSPHPDSVMQGGGLRPTDAVTEAQAGVIEDLARALPLLHAFRGCCCETERMNKGNGNLVSLTPERAREIGKLGGRPRKPRATEVEIQSLKERLEPRIRATVERLVELSQSEDESVSLRACNAILDRYYGKPCEASAPAESQDGRGFTMADLIPLAEAEQLLDGDLASHSKHT